MDPRRHFLTPSPVHSITHHSITASRARSLPPMAQGARLRAGRVTGYPEWISTTSHSIAIMRPIHRFALLLPLLAACGEGPTDPGDYSLEGTWRGGFPLELELDLEQDGDNRVTGGGFVRALEEELETVPDPDDPARVDTVSIDTVVTGTVEFDVRGDWDYPAFELRLYSEGYADAEYAGSFTAPDSIGGTLRGSGFGSEAIVITRQTAEP
jgi:hypothetical protein